jgi:hypothetical protein
MNRKRSVAELVAEEPRASERSRIAEEFDRLCDSLRLRLLEGTMPPDDAYWWTRIVASDSAALRS